MYEKAPAKKATENTKIFRENLKNGLTTQK